MSNRDIRISTENGIIVLYPVIREPELYHSETFWPQREPVIVVVLFKARQSTFRLLGTPTLYSSYLFHAATIPQRNEDIQLLLHYDTVITILQSNIS